MFAKGSGGGARIKNKNTAGSSSAASSSPNAERGPKSNAMSSFFAKGSGGGARIKNENNAGSSSAASSSLAAERGPKSNATPSVFAKWPRGGARIKNGNNAGSSFAASSSLVAERGPNASVREDPGFAGPEENGMMTFGSLLDCELADEEVAIGKLLKIKSNPKLNLVDKLITFLREQDLATFRQVGELSDDVVGQMRQFVPATVTGGTFNNFLKLRATFRPMVLQQGHVTFGVPPIASAGAVAQKQGAPTAVPGSAAVSSDHASAPPAVSRESVPRPRVRSTHSVATPPAGSSDSVPGAQGHARALSSSIRPGM
jgi:hypothetical protein